MWLRTSVAKSPTIAAKSIEVRVALDGSPSSLSAPAQRSEIAGILAAGVVRMKSRLAIRDPEIPNDPHKSPPTCLELSPESVLSVTNVVKDQ